MLYENKRARENARMNRYRVEATREKNCRTVSSTRGREKEERGGQERRWKEEREREREREGGERITLYIVHVHIYNHIIFD